MSLSEMPGAVTGPRSDNIGANKLLLERRSNFIHNDKENETVCMLKFKLFMLLLLKNE